MRSRGVAGDWPVITGCVRWEWCRLAASNQSSTRCRASLYHWWKVEAKQDPRQERLWSDRPWPLPPHRFHCNFEAMQSNYPSSSRRCSLRRHSAGTPPVGLTNFMRRFLACKYHSCPRPWLWWVIFHFIQSFFVILSARNPSSTIQLHENHSMSRFNRNALVSCWEARPTCRHLFTADKPE